MKPIKNIPNHELFFHFRKLQSIAHEVAYANSNTEMEYFTMHYLRPQLEKVEQLIGPFNEKNNAN